MKKLSILLLLFFQTLALFPQTDQLYELHNVFAPLDKSKIPTGILAQYGVQMVSFAPFNGVLTDSSYTSFDVWQMLYAGLCSSVTRANAQPESLSSVLERLKAAFAANPATVYLPTLCYSYASLDPNAATLGLITLQNEQLYDIPNKNPYQTQTLFAAAPSVSYAKGSSITFCINSNMYLSNMAATVSRLDVDFGNGQGYRQLYFNTPYSAPYSTSDSVTVKVKLTLSTGAALYSHFKMHVEVPPTRSPTEYPSYTINPKTGVHSGGKISWRLSTLNTTGKIRQPLIIAEGFDPLGVLQEGNFTLDNFLKTINWFAPSNSSMSFLDELNYSYYDIVYLDYNDGIDDIFRNAKLLEEAIEWVNGQKSRVAGAQPNVVMGISMGGLVAKTALRNMELEGKNHDTRLFISMDSPHKGANVPVGFQALLRHLGDLHLSINISSLSLDVFDVGNSVDMVKKTLEVLNSKAAKQMLCYSTTFGSNGFAYDNTVHQAFQQQYEAMGFPTQCRNVAVSNGSISGVNLFQPGSDIFDLYNKQKLSAWWILGGFYTWISTLSNYPQFTDIPLITYNSDIIIDINVKGTPNMKVASVYDGRVAVKKRILYFFTKEFNLTHESLNSTVDMLPYDGAPGGNYSTDISQVGNLAAEYKDMINTAMKQRRFTFIPIASSLAVSTTNPLNGLSNTNLIATGKTPFANYFAQSNNESHTQFTPKNARFILDELANSACVAPYGTTIIGPDQICSDNAQYSLSNNNTYTIVTWALSDNLTFVGSNIGNEITIKAKSITNDKLGYIYATIYSLGIEYHAPPKEIFIGKPLITLSQERVSSNYSSVNISAKVLPSELLKNIDNFHWTMYRTLTGYWNEDTQEPSIRINEQIFKIMLNTSNQCGETSQSLRIMSTNGTMFSISPNPATTEISVTSSSENLKSFTTDTLKATPINTIRIFDKMGMPVRIYTFHGTESRVTINVSSLPQGVYLIKINDTESHTIIKE